jgi:hypothetical protein
MGSKSGLQRGQDSAEHDGQEHHPFEDRTGKTQSIAAKIAENFLHRESFEGLLLVRCEGIVHQVVLCVNWCISEFQNCSRSTMAIYFRWGTTHERD